MACTCYKKKINAPIHQSVTESILQFIRVICQFSFLSRNSKHGRVILQQTINHPTRRQEVMSLLLQVTEYITMEQQRGGQRLISLNKGVNHPERKPLSFSVHVKVRLAYLLFMQVHIFCSCKLITFNFIIWWQEILSSRTCIALNHEKDEMPLHTMDTKLHTTCSPGHNILTNTRR